MREIRSVTRVTMAIETTKTVEIVEFSTDSTADWKNQTEISRPGYAVHPGIILRDEFLSPLDIRPEQLARDTNMSRDRIMGIVHGVRRITPDTASKLSKYFGVGADFWIDLQHRYDEACRHEVPQKLISEPATRRVS